MNKCGCIYIISLIVAVFVLYQQVTYTLASDESCTWSLWSPWNCSCCVSYNHIPTKRVRMKCCSNTTECPKLRISAEPIVYTDDDHEIRNECEKDICKDETKSYYKNCPHEPPEKNILSCQRTCTGFESGNGLVKIPSTPPSVTNQSAYPFTPGLQLQNNHTNTSNGTSGGGTNCSSTFSGLLPRVIIIGLFMQTAVTVLMMF
ncbi:uncharacterized protein LOC132726929 [Ruditapes philippinarum]|uniref:uncharacterized protein LOC132726929 n=1 Tax=Ruditapes philippinarum TaxID=129788 RepID=UPI00295BC2C0|nr:uncharacterized protein LOC132726929 [Ruditapes philippinarum]